MSSSRLQEQEYEAYQYYLQQHQNQLSLIQEDNTLAEGGGADEDYDLDNHHNEGELYQSGYQGF